jgi:hypothetical protein
MSEVRVPVSVSVTYSEPLLLLAEYSPVVAVGRGEMGEGEKEEEGGRKCRKLISPVMEDNDTLEPSYIN